MNPIFNIGRFHYESLVAYLKTGDIKAAAIITHISPPTLSKDLDFVKKKTGLNPRDPGDAKTLMQHIENLRKEAANGDERNH